MVTTPVGGAPAPLGEAGLAAAASAAQAASSAGARVRGALTAGWRGRSGPRRRASAVGPTLPKGAGLEAAACSERVSRARLVSGQDLVPGLGFPLVRVTRAEGFPSLLPPSTAPGSELWGWAHRTLTNLRHRYPQLPKRCQGPAWKLGLSLMLCNLLVSC